MSDMFIYMNRMYASVIDEDRGNIKRDNNYKNTKYHAEKESYINSNWKFYYWIFSIHVMHVFWRFTTPSINLKTNLSKLENMRIKKE